MKWIECYLCEKLINYTYFLWIDGKVRDICHDCYKKSRYGGEK